MKNTPDMIAQLRAMPYADYLLTEWWARVRVAALARAGGLCELRSSHRELGRVIHVHHCSYDRRGDEHPDDLLVVCAECHEAIHFGLLHPGQDVESALNRRTKREAEGIYQWTVEDLWREAAREKSANLIGMYPFEWEDDANEQEPQ